MAAGVAGCVTLNFLALASHLTSSSTAAVLPGTPLRELAEKRGLLFGTDIQDTWPDPYATDKEFKSISSRQFNFGNWCIDASCVNLHAWRLNTMVCSCP